MGDFKDLLGKRVLYVLTPGPVITLMGISPVREGVILEESPSGEFVKIGLLAGAAPETGQWYNSYCVGIVEVLE